ncbi:acetylornithine deacetylase [Teredinibacter sp. KSP-S5-2]|uniref:acetylornithine deacetylase n=1 Tax=Teredinibacter sp. KSP-S5-2 TaxID=3034506 RepID=UPI00293508FC|nr:acetylornithine deacetylase [Teredinibacter sp. KSP-S5-2]WNO08853.1 acetylornithine deacetylase [Teredinibacter sp. KSP-S5-2]
MLNTTLFKDRLHQLIATPSVSCTDDRIDMSNLAVIELLGNWLSDLGFKATIQHIADAPGKANLIATYGKGPGGLVLAGHTDTVPCNPDKWQQDPFQLSDRDNRFYGLGTTDMKGFFPVVLAAIESIKNQLHQLRQPIIVLATADEESSMSGARALTRASLPQARYAVIGEPTNMKPVRMHKGIMMERVSVQGLAGHSSNPNLGHNALDTMHTVLGELKAYRQKLRAEYTNSHFEIDYPTLNFGCVHGGDNPNRICNACELQFDLRPLPGMNLDDLHHEIDQKLSQAGLQDGTNVTVSKLFPGVEPYEEPASSELVKVAEQLTGYSSHAVAFATEAPFLQQLGMQTIVMGPGSIDQAHQPNEFIEQDQISTSVNIISQLITTLCR